MNALKAATLSISETTDCDDTEFEADAARLDSWADLNILLMTDHAPGKRLNEYLVSNDSKEGPCLETGTWDPTKNLEFGDKRATSSPQSVGVRPSSPPSSPEYDVLTGPAPVHRKAPS